MPAKAISGKSGRKYRFAEKLSDDKSSPVFRALSEGKAYLAKQESAHERNVLDSFYHPAVPRWMDQIEAKDGTWEVFEWREGKPLASYAAPLAPKYFSPFAFQLLDAIATLHEYGYMHGDISPSNVLFAPDRGEGGVSLVDFGLASPVFRKQKGEKTPGTPGWIPPERTEPSVVDARADLFAVGLLLDRFFAEKELAPEQLISIQKLRDPDPNQRFPDARAVMRALFPNRWEPRVHPEQIAIVSQSMLLRRSKAFNLDLNRIGQAIHPHLSINPALQSELSQAAKQKKLFQLFYALALNRPTLHTFAERLFALSAEAPGQTGETQETKTIEAAILAGKKAPGVASIKTIDNEGERLRLQGLTSYLSREYEKALEESKTARRYLAAEKRSVGYAKALNLAGAVHEKQRRFPLALAAYRRAAMVSAWMGEAISTGKSLFNAARLQQQLGRLGLAEEAFTRADYLFRAKDSWPDLAKVLVHYGRFKLALGQFSAAERVLAEAEQFNIPKSKLLSVGRQILLSDVCFEAGDDLRFSELFKKLWRSAASDKSYRSELSVLRAQYLHIQGKYEKAVAEIDEAFPKLGLFSIHAVERAAMIAKQHALAHLGKCDLETVEETLRHWRETEEEEFRISLLMDRYRLLTIAQRVREKWLPYEREKLSVREVLHALTTDTQIVYLEEKLERSDLRYAGKDEAHTEPVEPRSVADTDFVSRLTSEEDPLKILQTILHRMMEMAGATRGFTLEKQRNAIEVVLQLPPTEEAPLDLSMSVTKETLNSGTSFYTPDASSEARLQSSKSVEHFALRGIITFPLRVRGQIVAAVYLDNAEKPLHLTAAQQTELQHFADHAATTWQTAKLVQKLKRREEKITSLNADLQELLLQRERKIIELASQIDETSAAFPLTLAGESQAIRAVRALITRAAKHEVPVLICGRAGTGKRDVAQMIHRQSPRKSERLSHIDCAAIPQALISSELFGYVAGAFTGANKDYPGLLRAAGNGTVILETLEELPLSVQTKLADAITQKEVRPLGAGEPCELTARLVATLNHEPETALRKESLRSKLYFSLATIVIKTPLLRERPEDLPELIRSYLSKAGETMGKKRVRISARALKLCQTYDWPGNLPQLQATLQRAFAMADEEIDVEHLTDEVKGKPVLSPKDLTAPSGEALTLRQLLEETERRIVESTLVEFRGNTRVVAQKLGIPRSTLQDRIRKLGIRTKKTSPRKKQRRTGKKRAKK